MKWTLRSQSVKLSNFVCGKKAYRRNKTEDKQYKEGA